MKYAIILCLPLVLVGVMYAAEPEQRGTVSLQLSDVDVSEALNLLSQKAGITILGDPTVKGKVSCSLGDVTIKQALDTICKMNKLEWFKAYASAGADEKLSASKLLKLLDSLKGLGGLSLICEDPKGGGRMVFVPNAEGSSVDVSAIASGLKLKEVYLVRAEPDPAAVAAEKAKAEAQQRQPISPILAPPPSDPRLAAEQVWGYFSQMPMEQSFRVMGELRRMMYESLTPEQREQLRSMFGDRRPPWGRGDRSREGPPQGVQQPR